MRIYLPVLTGFIIYWVLYAPQPLLPLFAQTFALTESEAALLMSASFLPLMLAPLSYGYLLQAVPSVKVLRAAIFGLALSEIAFALSDTFALLVVIRFIQGLLLPAAFTSIMTYISANTEGAQLQRLMSIYIAVSIMGSYLGRLLAGAAASYLSWQLFIWAIAGALLLCFFALGTLPSEGQQKGAASEARLGSSKPQASLFLEVLQTGGYLPAYLAASCFFFIFAATTNYIPFRVKEILAQPSELISGLIYTSYLLGIGTSLGSRKLQTFFGSQPNALIAGFITYIIALPITLVPNIWLLFGAFCLICAAMFLLHTVAASMLNQQAKENKGIVNGLYLTFYYAGGTLGSYVPGVVYERAGWAAFVITLLAVAGVGVGMVLVYRKRTMIKAIST
ncbi:MAG: MFS transporter [Ardenticatenaceae bacterium]